LIGLSNKRNLNKDYIYDCLTYVKGTLHHHGEIELTAGELPLGNHHLVADAASCSGLLGDQKLVDHLGGDLLGSLGAVE